MFFLLAFLFSALSLSQNFFVQEAFAIVQEDFSAVQTPFAGQQTSAVVQEVPAAGEKGLAVTGNDSAAAPEAYEEGPSLLSRFGTRLKDTWQTGSWDLYVPAYTWHNRLMYDSARAQKYNETPWGAGIGKSMLDEDGDRHFLYIMGFQDSHDRFQPYGGYAFQKNWYAGDENQYSAGLGFALGITAREQYDYIPFPLPLPMAELRYKRLAVQAVYIPGGYNDGNVLFTWLRWNFE